MAQTPPDFLFAVKASRYLTHVKRLNDLGPGLDRFYACIEPLLESAKMGPILWQLPPTFRRDDDRLRTALERLSHTAQRHCFEFRHPSWFADEVYGLLREHGAALVIGDRPEVKPFQAHVFTADWTFVRFHYGSRGRRGNYSERELEEWVARVEELAASAREVHAVMNNCYRDFAVVNAAQLARLLGGEAVGAPEQQTLWLET